MLGRTAAWACELWTPWSDGLEKQPRFTNKVAQNHLTPRTATNPYGQIA